MKKTIIWTSIALLAIIIFCYSSCTRIDAGHEGVLVRLYGGDKGVQDVSLVTGRVWYDPFMEDVHEFPVFVQTADYEPFTVNAKDGSVFTVDPTITYKVITTTTLYNYVRDAFRIQFNEFTTDSMISNRKGFESAVQAQLSTELTKEGFQLEQLTSGIVYPESITQAIDAKDRAVQQAMQVENELRVAEANVRKLIVQAEAESSANLLRQQSLTPLLIQQQFIEKRDGKTPLYGNSPVMFKNVQ